MDTLDLDTSVRRSAALYLLAALSGVISLAPVAAAEGDDYIRVARQKGANIYCFMRSQGTNHATSWRSAYAVMKRQKTGFAAIFKTSPEHASTMILEEVAENPGNFPGCGVYLDTLF